MLFHYFLNDSEMGPAANTVTGITSVLTFHVHCISIVWPLHSKIFLASFLITFLSPEIAMSIIRHLLLLLLIIIISSSSSSSSSNSSSTREILEVTIGCTCKFVCETKKIIYNIILCTKVRTGSIH